jgi:trimeric autotransporter adhesin
LMYAGIDGNNDYQGDPPPIKVSPRLGIVYSLTQRAVLRAGYGMFWAPWNYQFPGTSNYGNIGFTQSTFIAPNVETSTPTTVLRNPFPTGLTPPSGNTTGLLTGVGGTVETIDQNKKAPYVQQMSVDYQYQLTDEIAVSAGFAHARGDQLGLGGTNDGVVNINQIRPDVARNFTPAQLLESVPNPFFGIAGFGTFAISPTIARGQLLRPFPQFGDVNLLQVTEGKSRYNALILKLDKRVNNGWGGRFNYTFSRLEDNQFGESNHFADRGSARPQDNYNLDAEYSLGYLDSPHKLVLAPIVELPFGQGKKWATSRVADLLVGGWTLSAVASFESGFPQATRYGTGESQTHLALFGNNELRPNITGGDPNTSGDLYDRIGGATPWADREGYERPTRGQFGNGPRTDDRIRTPFRKNLDFVATKAFRTGGSTRAEVRFELLNATNTPKFRAYEPRLDQGTYGQITRQSAFMRITQISMRFSF